MAFFDVVAAVGDLPGHLMSVAAMQALSVAWLPERIAGTSYQVSEIGVQVGRCSGLHTPAALARRTPSFLPPTPPGH